MGDRYVPYQIKVEASERWMDRPIKVSLTTPTSAGSNSSVFYLDEVEAASLIAQLEEFLR